MDALSLNDARTICALRTHQQQFDGTFPVV
jgi:hypothetical protein